MWQMSLRAKAPSCRFALSTTFSICGVVLSLLPTTAVAQLAPTKRAVSPPSQTSLFVDCPENEKPKNVLSSLALSEDKEWRAYVEVNVHNERGCLHTTQLWVARVSRPYRLLYLMPPRRDQAGNGMEILGWARNSRMLLAKSDLWQDASDAPDEQQILAFDAETGELYEPDLKAMLRGREDKQCAFRVTDAGFGSDKSVVVLVRAKFFTGLAVDEAESDVPAAKRCGDSEETWSFNYATGEIKRVGDAEPLHLFKKFLPNPRVR
jgi:hypothetical protein